MESNAKRNVGIERTGRLLTTVTTVLEQGNLPRFVLDCKLAEFNLAPILFFFTVHLARRAVTVTVYTAASLAAVAATVARVFKSLFSFTSYSIQ